MMRVLTCTCLGVRAGAMDERGDERGTGGGIVRFSLARC